MLFQGCCPGWGVSQALPCSWPSTVARKGLSIPGFGTKYAFGAKQVLQAMFPKEPQAQVVIFLSGIHSACTPPVTGASIH